MSDNIFLTNRTLKNIDNYFNQPSYNNFQSRNNNLFTNRSNHYSTPFNPKVQFNLPEENIPFYTDDNEFDYDQIPSTSYRNEIRDDLDNTIYKSAINKTAGNPFNYDFTYDLSDTNSLSNLNNLSTTSKNMKNLIATTNYIK